MARKLFEKQGIRTRAGALATGSVFVVYTDSAGTVLADISATSGGSAIAGSTVTVTDRPGLGLATLLFYGPTDGTDTLFLRCPADSSLDVQEIEADEDERLDALVAASGIPPATVDAKGDLIAGTADNTVSRLAVGANGTVLTAASGQATGLQWAAPAAETLPATLLDAKGDLIVATAADTPARLAVGATNGYGLLADSTQTAGVRWGIDPSAKMIRPKTGLYYVGTDGAVGAAAFPLGTMATSPIHWGGGSIDRIGIGVTIVGTAGNVVRLGIYLDGGNGYPGALLLDAGTVPGDAVATPEITISQSLPPGLYHLVSCSQGVTTAPTVRVSTGTTAGNFTVGGTTGANISGNTFTGYDQTGVTGALPANFSAAVSSAGNTPRVFIRAA